MTAKPKLLWVGDAGVPTGFARATHEICDVLKNTYEVYVLGVNYRGDPHPYSYPIWASGAGGDALGIGRLIWLCDIVKPDVIVIQSDPWIIPLYTNQLRQFDAYKDVPVIGYVAVDGLNCKAKPLNHLALGVFWTEFGLAEARLGGFTRPGCVIPLGVDTAKYFQEDKVVARRHRALNAMPRYESAFIVGNVNRNQPRKRMDLTVRYFSEWVKKYRVEDAYLYLHVAPTGDKGFDCEQLAEYYGVKERLMLMQPEMFYGLSDDQLRDTYNSFDLLISTTQGEGFGLTTFEAMACRVPCLVPAWSALGELTSGAAMQVGCTSTAATHNNINVIGGVMDEWDCIEALQELYTKPDLRQEYADAGYERAQEDRFRWKTVGAEFTKAVDQVCLTPVG